MFAKESNLFIDDALIDHSSGLKRTTHQPRKHPDPLLDQERPAFQLNVLREEATGRFRMWYNAMGHPIEYPRIGVAYAESADGIRWNRPVLGYSWANYIDGPGHWARPVVDDGPGVVAPQQRYKTAWFEPGKGMCVAFSPDGMRFTPWPDNPVLAENCAEDAPEIANIVSDIMDICVDPLQKRYLMCCKVWRGGYPGKPHHAPRDFRRCVAVSTSSDFITWDRPRVIVTPDASNGLEEFYGLAPMVRGNQYVGFLRILRDDLPATPAGPTEGVGWTELASSRDGVSWQRHPDPFLDRDGREGRWDHAMAWFGDCVTVGERDYIYYAGYRAGHKIRSAIGDRSIGVAFLRKDGFVSRDAGAAGGRLRTRLAALPDAAMCVNADVRGEMRVRLVLANGSPAPGFDWADCTPMRGDSVAHRVRWKDGCRPSGRQPFSLEFRLMDADLYGFGFIA